MEYLMRVMKIQNITLKRWLLQRVSLALKEMPKRPNYYKTRKKRIRVNFLFFI